MNVKEHIKIDMFFLGYTDPTIHRIIDDLESLKFKGPSHRMFGHNWITLNFIKASGGERSFYIALLHILVDFDIIMNRKKLMNYINKFR